MVLPYSPKNFLESLYIFESEHEELDGWVIMDGWMS